MAVTTVLGYLVIAQFFFLEGRLRRTGEARDMQAGQFDQRSTRLIGLAYMVSILVLLLSWLLNWFQIGVLSVWVGWLGICIALAGLLVRWWSMRVLGAFYTRTLKVVENHSIVQDGPYRLIRHPGYLGSILMWAGVAAATANWIVFLIILAMMLAVYHYRMENEEKMLVETQPEYAEYKKRTWRLIPLLY